MIQKIGLIIALLIAISIVNSSATQPNNVKQKNGRFKVTSINSRAPDHKPIFYMEHPSNADTIIFKAIVKYNNTLTWEGIHRYTRADGTFSNNRLLLWNDPHGDTYALEARMVQDQTGTRLIPAEHGYIRKVDAIERTKLEPSRESPPAKEIQDKALEAYIKQSKAHKKTAKDHEGKRAILYTVEHGETTTKLYEASVKTEGFKETVRWNMGSEALEYKHKYTQEPLDSIMKVELIGMIQEHHQIKTPVETYGYIEAAGKLRETQANKPLNELTPHGDSIDAGNALIPKIKRRSGLLACVSLAASAMPMGLIATAPSGACSEVLLDRKAQQEAENIQQINHTVKMREKPISGPMVYQSGNEISYHWVAEREVYILKIGAIKDGVLIKEMGSLKMHPITAYDATQYTKFAAMAPDTQKIIYKAGYFKKTYQQSITASVTKKIIETREGDMALSQRGNAQDEPIKVMNTRVIDKSTQTEQITQSTRAIQATNPREVHYRFMPTNPNKIQVIEPSEIVTLKRSLKPALIPLGYRSKAESGYGQEIFLWSDAEAKAEGNLYWLPVKRDAKPYQQSRMQQRYKFDRTYQYVPLEKDSQLTKITNEQERQKIWEDLKYKQAGDIFEEGFQVHHYHGLTKQHPLLHESTQNMAYSQYAAQTGQDVNNLIRDEKTDILWYRVRETKQDLIIEQLENRSTNLDFSVTRTGEKSVIVPLESLGSDPAHRKAVVERIIRDIQVKRHNGTPYIYDNKMETYMFDPVTRKFSAKAEKSIQPEVLVLRQDTSPTQMKRGDAARHRQKTIAEEAEIEVLEHAAQTQTPTEMQSVKSTKSSRAGSGLCGISPLSANMEPMGLIAAPPSGACTDGAVSKLTAEQIAKARENADILRYSHALKKGQNREFIRLRKERSTEIADIRAKTIPSSSDNTLNSTATRALTKEGKTLLYPTYSVDQGMVVEGSLPSYQEAIARPQYNNSPMSAPKADIEVILPENARRGTSNTWNGCTISLLSASTESMGLVATASGCGAAYRQLPRSLGGGQNNRATETAMEEARRIRQSIMDDMGVREPRVRTQSSRQNTMPQNHQPQEAFEFHQRLEMDDHMDRILGQSGRPEARFMPPPPYGSITLPPPPYDSITPPPPYDSIIASPPPPPPPPQQRMHTVVQNTGNTQRSLTICTIIERKIGIYKLPSLSASTEPMGLIATAGAGACGETTPPLPRRNPSKRDMNSIYVNNASAVRASQMEVLEQELKQVKTALKEVHAKYKTMGNELNKTWENNRGRLNFNSEELEQKRQQNNASVEELVEAHNAEVHTLRDRQRELNKQKLALENQGDGILAQSRPKSPAIESQVSGVVQVASSSPQPQESPIIWSRDNTQRVLPEIEPQVSGVVQVASSSSEHQRQLLQHTVRHGRGQGMVNRSPIPPPYTDPLPPSYAQQTQVEMGTQSEDIRLRGARKKHCTISLLSASTSGMGLIATGSGVCGGMMHSKQTQQPLQGREGMYMVASSSRDVRGSVEVIQPVVASSSRVQASSSSSAVAPSKASGVKPSSPDQSTSTSIGSSEPSKASPPKALKKRQGLLAGLAGGLVVTAVGAAIGVGISQSAKKKVSGGVVDTPLPPDECVPGFVWDGFECIAEIGTSAIQFESKSSFISQADVGDKTSGVSRLDSPLKLTQMFENKAVGSSSITSSMVTVGYSSVTMLGEHALSVDSLVKKAILSDSSDSTALSIGYRHGYKDGLGTLSRVSYVMEGLDTKETSGAFLGYKRLSFNGLHLDMYSGVSMGYHSMHGYESAGIIGIAMEKSVGMHGMVSVGYQGMRGSTGSVSLGYARGFGKAVDTIGGGNVRVEASYGNTSLFESTNSITLSLSAGYMF